MNVGGDFSGGDIFYVVATSVEATLVGGEMHVIHFRIYSYTDL